MAKIHELIATVLGLGHLPLAPGTWGSAAGLVLCILLYPYPVFYFAAFILLFIAGGISAGKLEKENGIKDPSYVVIDEFACIFIVFAFLPLTLLNIVLGFILFRLFDVIKPPPIRLLENVGGKWGMMLDDAMAAVYANIILQIVTILFFKDAF